jgi:hypothetical protein
VTLANGDAKAALIRATAWIDATYRSRWPGARVNGRAQGLAPTKLAFRQTNLAGRTGVFGTRVSSKVSWEKNVAGRSVSGPAHLHPQPELVGLSINLDDRERLVPLHPACRAFFGTVCHPSSVAQAMADHGRRARHQLFHQIGGPTSQPNLCAPGRLRAICDQSSALDFCITTKENSMIRLFSVCILLCAVFIVPAEARPRHRAPPRFAPECFTIMPCERAVRPSGGFLDGVGSIRVKMTRDRRGHAGGHPRTDGDWLRPRGAPGPLHRRPADLRRQCRLRACRTRYQGHRERAGALVRAMGSGVGPRAGRRGGVVAAAAGTWRSSAGSRVDRSMYGIRVQAAAGEKWLTGTVLSATAYRVEHCLKCITSG